MRPSNRFAAAGARAPWTTKRVGKLVTAIGFLAAGCEASAQDRKGVVPIEVNPKARREWKLDTANEAIERCRQIVGRVEAMADGEPVISLVKLTTDNTPYLSEQVVARPLWHMVVPNWSIVLKSAPEGRRDPYRRTLDVFMDPTNGCVLKIESRWPRNVPPIIAQPSAEVATRLLRSAGNETYHSFPSEAPKVTFVDALEILQKAGVGVIGAKQLIGQYVVMSTMSKLPKPVWAITLRGVFPIRVPPGWPRDARYEYRYIIDAETGRLESVTSTPSPMYLPGNFPVKQEATADE